MEWVRKFLFISNATLQNVPPRMPVLTQSLRMSLKELHYCVLFWLSDPLDAGHQNPLAVLDSVCFVFAGKKDPVFKLRTTLVNSFTIRRRNVCLKMHIINIVFLSHIFYLPSLRHDVGIALRIFLGISSLAMRPMK